MSIIITDECINCGACEPECPNNAIYEGGAEWRFADGTSLKGDYTGKSTNVTVDAGDTQDPVTGGAFGADGNDLYYIVPDKCTECKGFHDEPQCAAVCPVDCCVDDPDHRESDEQLLSKKDSMHL
ncbi:MAG: ferredoxin [Bacteroidetes bacterium]|nr:MAG: ferredoxin [Bacteroidota bacterium]